MLELKNIKKSYKVGNIKQEVLKDITINFSDQEFTSILGASGSGKTTLLNVIGGLDKYDDGELIIDGISTKQYTDSNWDSYRNYRIGFIFQNYNLIMHQSVLSNVEIALTLSGVSKSEKKKRAKQALEKVGLKEHMNKKPNQLSGGQMQRVAIARAIVNNPDIILADEPTGALDSETSIQIMDLLKDLSKDKLVIMVTHNPELAKKYSTRIIELKDGNILNDSKPVKKVDNKKEAKKIAHTSLSFFTTLQLSFNNLLTKKGRTFLTAFAGSIGIIGIALILSLSNGVSNYVNDIERNSLSDFPISLEESSYDLSNIMALPSEVITDEENLDSNKIYSDDDIGEQIKFLTKDVIKKNNLKEFKKYIESHDEFRENSTAIQYGYDLDLQIYSTNNSSYTRINPNTFNLSEDYNMDNDESGISLNYASATEKTLFEELIDNNNILNDNYEILAGKLPEEYNEIVLIVGKNNKVPNSVLYSLDLRDRAELSSLLNSDDIKIETKSYSYEDILNTKYKLVLNTDYYKKENGVYKDYSNDQEYMKNLVNNGLDIKVVGILKDKEQESYGMIGYRHSLTEYVINSIAKTDIYKEQTANKEIDILTGEKFDGYVNTYEANCKKLGIADLDNPSSINIYPKNYDSKNTLIQLIDTYNSENSKNGRDDLVISYTDLIKTVIGGITGIIKVVSMVLIAFVAISLIVSSIMIAIITYISVLERTKEIGILRAIGASKKDITRVFTSETIIEGFIAGILGIGITLLLCLPINAIVGVLAEINNIAALPILSAIILVIFSILLNIIAGLIPAKMASKKDPVEALRSE